MLKLDPQARILIVRLSAIGDVMHTMPLLPALRDALPQAHLSWVVEDRAAGLLRGHKALDELIVVPRRWYRSPAVVLGLRRRLRAMKFDVAIDVQCLSKSSLVAWISGAPTRIGYDGADGREISRWLNNLLVLPQRQHVIDRNLELLKPLGIQSPEVRFDLDDTEASSSMAERTLDKLGLDRFALLNPGAGWASKRWPTDRFAKVARYLGQSCALRSLVAWGGDQERLMAEEIVAGSSGYAVLAPTTNLRELTAIGRRASLFIGSDTSVLHMAAAVGTPCIGLFGPMPAVRNGPYGSQHIALQKILLTGSRTERRTAGPESMEAITVDDVCGACDQILSRSLIRQSA